MVDEPLSTTTTCSCKRARRASSGAAAGLEQVGFWNKLVEHPTYDAFWRDQAVDKVLAAQPLKVPVMLVHSLWDQEDIYGAPAVYKAIKPKDTGNDKVFLVMGPWHHGQEIREGSALGAIRFNSDTALTFRREILRPFLDQYLVDGAPKADIAPVTAFETGTNTWRRLPAWPAGCASGCTVKATPLYLAAGSKLSFAAPKPDVSAQAFDEYVSDPAKPVPFRARPDRSLELRQGPELARVARDRSARSLWTPGRRWRSRRTCSPRRSRSAESRSRTWSPRRAERTPTGWSS